MHSSFNESFSQILEQIDKKIFHASQNNRLGNESTGIVIFVARSNKACVFIRYKDLYRTLDPQVFLKDDF